MIFHLMAQLPQGGGALQHGGKLLPRQTFTGGQHLQFRFLFASAPDVGRFTIAALAVCSALEYRDGNPVFRRFLPWLGGCAVVIVLLSMLPAGEQERTGLVQRQPVERGRQAEQGEVLQIEVRRLA